MPYPLDNYLSNKVTFELPDNTLKSGINRLTDIIKSPSPCRLAILLVFVISKSPD
jgi:hypothetical protein